MISRITKLEEIVEKKKKDEVVVPNDVRYKVRQAYDEKLRKGEEVCKIEGSPGSFNEVNLAVTNYIRAFASGLFPNLENRDVVINSPIKIYYESKVSSARRKQSHPDKVKEAAKNQRKIHKAERRRLSLKKPVTNLKNDMKNGVELALIPEMMSSEEESEDDNG